MHVSYIFHVAYIRIWFAYRNLIVMRSEENNFEIANTDWIENFKTFFYIWLKTQTNIKFNLWKNSTHEHRLIKKKH